MDDEPDRDVELHGQRLDLHGDECFLDHRILFGPDEVMKIVHDQELDTALLDRLPYFLEGLLPPQWLRVPTEKPAGGHELRVRLLPMLTGQGVRLEDVHEEGLSHLLRGHFEAVEEVE